MISRVPEIVKREYQLEDYVVAALEQYARMIGSPPDHVVNSAIKMTVMKDKDFSRWRKEQNASSRNNTNTNAKPGAKP